MYGLTEPHFSLNPADKTAQNRMLEPLFTEQSANIYMDKVSLCYFFS